MKDNKTTTGGGIGFCGLLTIAFIVLKLCHVIEWSWVWALCPVWIPLAIVVIVLVVAVITELAKG